MYKRTAFSWKAPALAVMVAVLVLPALAQPVSKEEGRTGDAYTLATCPVSGGKLGSMGDPVVKVYDGREIRFCCASCVPTFEADTETYLKKLDTIFAAQQMARYPLDTCVVSGEKLGGMGDPVDYVYNNRLVRFCCAGCIDTFLKAPEGYLEKLDKAVKEKAKEPGETCIVSGEKLGSMGEPVEYIVANRLVRLCCAGCIKGFEKEPAKYLLALDQQAGAAAGKEER